MSNLTRVNDMKSSHLLQLQRKLDTVGLFKPDMATDQDLHCLPLVLSHITLNIVSPDQGPVVQSIVSLKSSLAVKMLTVLVSAISNSQVFFAGKMGV